MHKARHILAVVAVTTALCADQVVTAAPMPKPQVGDIAARVMERLAQPFRRTAPSAVRPLVQTRTAFTQVDRKLDRPLAVLSLNCELSPFQFRLPPPSIL